MLIGKITTADYGYHTPTFAVFQWHSHLFKKPGNYFVVTNNTELSRLQGVKPGDSHVDCIVDDFGDLVRAVQ